MGKKNLLSPCVLRLLICLFILLLGSLVVHTLYKRTTPFPIDLVYLWVDGEDPSWLAKKTYWQKKYGIYNEYVAGPSRYRDRNELKYSLRSTEKYLPWVRTIFIVTDHQIPKWLNVNHPKIRIIDHTDIFPKDALPVFNSSAIETRVPFIPGLAEHFLYTNDDVFVNKPLTWDFFFTKEGLPIHYDDVRITKELEQLLNFPGNEIPKANYQFSMDILKNVYKIDFEKAPTYSGTHTITAYRKSDFLDNLRILGDHITRTTYSKFRDAKDITRGIFVIPDNLKGKNVIKSALNIPGKCGVAGKLIMKNMTALETENPCMFCLNDAPSLTNADLEAHSAYLQKRFPNKSSFEL